MSWQDLIDQSATKPTPDDMTLISDNGISIVHRANDGFIYKHSIPYLINNEFAFLQELYSTGFVPSCERHDKYTLKVEDLGESEPVVRKRVFMDSCQHFFRALKTLGIRHGDLTRPHIIVKNDKPKVIDWAEARWSCDSADDKRPEGDEYWLRKTMEQILEESNV